jgi:DNA mismatch repair protein MutS
MRQYAEQKAQVGDALLLFRMGDFYETFYEDAITAARVLGIALTSRNKSDENPVPLAGIPYHALDGYLQKLVHAGFRVAISEQMEDARQAKGVVRRDIVRIVTPGTLTDEALLDEKQDNLLACICVDGESVGLATAELSAGRLLVYDTLGADAVDELVRLAPAELIVAEHAEDAPERLARRVAEACKTAISRRPAHEFGVHQAERCLLEHFEVATLAGFGFGRMTLGLRAAGVLVAYLRETQRTTLDHITSLRRRDTSRFVSIDQNSWRALEIERTLRGDAREGSLLAAVDRTVHPMGARRLREWICLPLKDADEIVARQDAVATFVEQERLRRSLRERLRGLADVQRVAARVALLRASPRDLANIGRTLSLMPELQELLARLAAPVLCEACAALGGLEDLAELLTRAVRSDAPLTAREGEVIADGYHAELDRLRGIRNDGRSYLADYQRRLIDELNIPTLKVGYNKVFGYYI